MTHSDVFRLHINGIIFPFLTNVAIKLSHTLLLDCLTGPGSYSCLQILEQLMIYYTFSS